MVKSLSLYNRAMPWMFNAKYADGVREIHLIVQIPECQVNKILIYAINFYHFVLMHAHHLDMCLGLGTVQNEIQNL